MPCLIIQHWESRSIYAITMVFWHFLLHLGALLDWHYLLFLAKSGRWITVSHSPFHVIRCAHSSSRFPTGGLPLRIYRTSTPFKRILLLRCPSAVFPYFLLGHSSLTGKSSLMRRPSDWPREGTFQHNGGPSHMEMVWFPFKISEDVGGWDSRHWGMTTRSLWQRPMKIPPRSLEDMFRLELLEVVILKLTLARRVIFLTLQLQLVIAEMSKSWLPALCGLHPSHFCSSWLWPSATIHSLETRQR